MKTIDQTVATFAAVANTGNADAANVVVRFTDNGVAIGEQTVATLGKGTAQNVSITGSLARGSHAIAVTADLANSIPEADEQNNTRTVPIIVK